MIKAVFHLTLRKKLIKMEEEIERIFECTFRMKILAKDLHLSLNNNS